METLSISAYYRPGVYSEYDLSGVVYGGGRGGLVGLAAVNTTAEEKSVNLITGYEQAENKAATTAKNKNFFMIIYMI